MTYKPAARSGYAYDRCKESVMENIEQMYGMVNKVGAEAYDVVYSGIKRLHVQIQ